MTDTVSAGILGPVSIKTIEAIVNASPQTLATTSGESNKGAQAREKMLCAALDVFGQHGFDGATTRMLAQHAGMNLGAIPYYFGSKEDLYSEAADHLGKCLQSSQEPLLYTLMQDTDLGIERGKLCDKVVAFLVGQACTFINDDIPKTWVQFFLRAQGESGVAFEHLHKRVIAPAHAALAPLIARIIDSEPGAPDTLTLTLLAQHQTLHICLMEPTLLKHWKWSQLSAETMSILLETIGQAIRTQLLHFPTHRIAPPDYTETETERDKG